MKISGENYTLYRGDCLDILPTLEAGSVDAVITDPPYGTTACKWDSVIPFEAMWAGIKHVIKERAAVVLFGSQPFTSALVMSNVDMFRQEIIWDKVLPVGFLDSNRRMMRRHENIILFSVSGYTTFNAQKTSGHKTYIKTKRKQYEGYSAFKTEDGTNTDGTRFPTSIKKVSVAGCRSKTVHPTQKPVALMEYLIRTYTNEGDTVLDFTMGSGSTGVAALRTGRKFIGIELDPDYFDIAVNRIANASGDYVETAKEKRSPQVSMMEMFA
jgi:site-specific DNA-methyltransferase (adenine-specific)